MYTTEKRDKIYIIVDDLITNVYTKPKELIKLFLRPASVYGINYFPEHQEKHKLRIFFDQFINILKFGHVDTFYYLYGLNLKNFRNKKNFVHYNLFSKRRKLLNWSSPSNSSVILRNKLYFGIFAKAIGVKTPLNIISINDGNILDLNTSQPITLDNFIQNYKGTYFCKPLDGECGYGIFKLSLTGEKVLINNVDSTKEELQKLVENKQYIVQTAINQHPIQSSLHKESINTLRLVTVRDLKTQEIKVFPSMLRIGTGKNVVDNTSKGGIAVGFDLKTGRLNEFGLQKPEFGTRTNVHPDSGIIFKDYYIPFLNEAVDKAKFFHSFLDLHSVGWDIAITENGPVFIEGNDRWEINGPQSCNGGLMEEFKKYFF
ncbi:MAG: hypothetical protein J1E38_08220 [Paramuribaculum sp.]|nr:hypothetical protein [Paramuribaculum sp.]